MFELRPDILRIQTDSLLRQSQGLRPFALIGRQGEQEPMGTDVLWVDLDRVLQVGYRIGGARFDLLLGSQHERIRVERFDEDAGGFFRSGSDAEDHPAFGIDRADHGVLFVVDRHGAEVRDLQLPRKVGHGNRFGEFDDDRCNDVIPVADLDAFEWLDRPRRSSRSIVAGHRLAGAPVLLDHGAAGLARQDAAKTCRVDRKRRHLVRRHGLRLGLRRGNGVRGFDH